MIFISIKMRSMPIEILELISLYYPDLCHSMILAFRLTRLSSKQRFLKSHFTKRFDKNGKITYSLPNGLRHRDNDQPAIIRRDGTKEWYYNGQHHRDNDQPAIIYHNG